MALSLRTDTTSNSSNPAPASEGQPSPQSTGGSKNSKEFLTDQEYTTKTWQSAKFQWKLGISVQFGSTSPD